MGAGGDDSAATFPPLAFADGVALAPADYPAPMYHLASRGCVEGRKVDLLPEGGIEPFGRGRRHLGAECGTCERAVHMSAPGERAGTEGALACWGSSAGSSGTPCHVADAGTSRRRGDKRTPVCVCLRWS